MKLYRAAVPIAPQWTEQDRTRAMGFLAAKIAKEAQLDPMAVMNKIRFTDWKTGFTPELVATVEIWEAT